MELIAIVTKENVSKYLKKVQNDAEVHIYLHYADLPSEVNGKRFLAIYLDLDLLKEEGYDIPANVKYLVRHSRVVVSTADPGLVPPLNYCHYFAVLEKPFKETEVEDICADIRQVYCEQNEILRFRANRAVIRIRYELINYIIADRHHIILSLRNGYERYRYRFSGIETLLRDERFLTCNRGVIINMQNVKSFDGMTFTMPDGRLIDIKLRTCKEIRTTYYNYCRNHECRPA